MEWYRWDTISEAQEALDYLNNHPALPHVGKNASSGEQEPDSCMTTNWCDKVTECTDGKFGFPRVSTAWLDELGISLSERQYFIEVYVYGMDYSQTIPEPTSTGTIETFTSTWIASDIDFP